MKLSINRQLVFWNRDDLFSVYLQVGVFVALTVGTFSFDFDFRGMVGWCDFLVGLRFNIWFPLFPFKTIVLLHATADSLLSMP